MFSIYLPVHSSPRGLTYLVWVCVLTHRVRETTAPLCSRLQNTERRFTVVCFSNFFMSASVKNAVLKICRVCGVFGSLPMYLFIAAKL